jgi:hypothetical protein
MLGTSSQDQTNTGPVASALAKATASRAGDVCARYAPSEATLAKVGNGHTDPADLLNALIAEGKLVDAVTFLAHALPRREGTWWACQAARTVPLGDDAALPRRVVRAAEAWVFSPDDTARRAAMDLAEELGFESPASWAGIAAFWSGDSLAPPDQPKVPPRDHLWCHAVNGAVLLAAAQGPAPTITTRHRALLAQGLDIANGGTGRPSAARDE